MSVEKYQLLNAQDKPAAGNVPVFPDLRLKLTHGATFIALVLACLKSLVAMPSSS